MSGLLGEVLADTKRALKVSGIDSWRIDSELIVMECTGCTRVQLITREDVPLTEEQLKRVSLMLERRLKREPMQYILGKCEFMGLDFELNSDTLIPRGDTECLVELTLEHIKASGAKTALDIGTGSGAIIVSLAKLSQISGVAVDISQNALAMAQKNAVSNGVADKIQFVESNLFENVKGKFDVIVSNPPYIESEVVFRLDSQVKDFEPLRALDGGEDGLDFYRAITAEAPRYLTEGGLLAFEIGYNQGKAVSDLMKRTGFEDVSVGQDLAGLDRTVCGILRKQ
jgi:release factor glutamine methyltransferase